MTRAANTLHHGHGEPAFAESDSPALESLVLPANADELASYARERMDPQDTAAFKAWTLATACRDVQGWS